MLKWALIFLAIALIAGALGPTLAGLALGMAKAVFFLALVLFILFIALGATLSRRMMRWGRAPGGRRVL